ncbi:hypothetical protein SUGI_0997860 [Cryptomeria japonica]|nr:hypothetical protein SUGI_0997860 [Cryptomeria japonica]
MRRHGWELPYHPLQVVAVAVVLALAFAFYVFFVPFIGNKLFEYIGIGLYSPLVTSVFCLYIWCAATDPGDPGVFRSKKYGNVSYSRKASSTKNPLTGSAPSVDGTNTDSIGEKIQSEGPLVTVLPVNKSRNLTGNKSGCSDLTALCMVLCAWFPLVSACKNYCSRKQSVEEQVCDDDMLYCSLCEVEVFKFSKHCRVCDKCVDGFDHHCRWINNCIGKKNYKGFFVLMVSALLLVFIIRFDVEITSKLGSGFSLVPFVIVVASCTVLAMVASLPLGQLFFFHVLLMKKGISTYDYIIAMREQEQEAMEGVQSPQMSPLSSATAISSASSVSALHRGAWCTPPRLFVEDQFSVLRPEGATSSLEAGNMHAHRKQGGRMGQKNSGTVKISPWTLARLNAEEVSKAAAQARKKSKVLQPISRQDKAAGIDTASSLGSSSRDINTDNIPRFQYKKRSYKRGHQQSPPQNFASRSSRSARFPMKPLTKAGQSVDHHNMNINHSVAESSARLAPLQFEARNAFRSSLAMSNHGQIASSPESSLTSPDIQPFRESTASKIPPNQLAAPLSFTKGVRLCRSTSDGYEASGGDSPDDSDQASASTKPNWNSLLFNRATTRGPIVESLPSQMNAIPYRIDKLKSVCQTSELRMQANSGKDVITKPAEVPHVADEIDFCPSQCESPERV